MFKCFNKKEGFEKICKKLKKNMAVFMMTIKVEGLTLKLLIHCDFFPVCLHLKLNNYLNATSNNTY